MSEPFIGQVEVFGFGFAPRYWATCSGQLIAITQNQALFSLLGTTYGGDGRTTFALPELRGRLPMGFGGSYSLGARTGSETVTLQEPQVPGHSHPPLMASNNKDTANNTNTPAGNLGLGVTTGSDKSGAAITVNAYIADAAPKAVLHPTAVSQFGGQPHENRMPSLALNFCISLFGTFPSRN